jgi:hypothetical protein
MLESSNRFCYLFGSFNNELKLKNKTSDVDVLCNRVDENEARRLLIEQFGSKMKTVKIDHKQAVFRGNTIYPIMCYWQKCSFYELFNEQGIKYNFNCNSDYVYNFGAQLRNPNKSVFSNYLQQKKILNVGVNFDFDKSIKHYGEKNYQIQLEKLDVQEKKFLNAIRQRGWKVNTHCKQLLGSSYDIDTQSHTIKSIKNVTMCYEEFLEKCY